MVYSVNSGITLNESTPKDYCAKNDPHLKRKSGSCCCNLFSKIISITLVLNIIILKW